MKKILITLSVLLLMLTPLAIAENDAKVSKMDKFDKVTTRILKAKSAKVSGKVIVGNLVSGDIDAKNVSAKNVDVYLGVSANKVIATTSVSGKTVEATTTATSDIVVTRLTRLESLTSDPTDSQDGDIWYRDDLKKYRVKENGVVVSLVVS